MSEAWSAPGSVLTSLSVTTLMHPIGTPRPTRYVGIRANGTIRPKLEHTTVTSLHSTPSTATATHVRVSTNPIASMSSLAPLI